MLRDKVAKLIHIVESEDICPIKNGYPTLGCLKCVANEILELCRKEIGEVFKEYEVTQFRKDLIQKFNERFMGFEDVKTDMPKMRD